MGDLKKKKHLMMVMMSGGKSEPRSDRKEGRVDRIGEEVVSLAERSAESTTKSSYKQVKPIHVEF